MLVVDLDIRLVSICDHVYFVVPIDGNRDMWFCHFLFLLQLLLRLCVAVTIITVRRGPPTYLNLIEPKLERLPVWWVDIYVVFWNSLPSRELFSVTSNQFPSRERFAVFWDSNHVSYVFLVAVAICRMVGAVVERYLAISDTVPAIYCGPFIVM